MSDAERKPEPERLNALTAAVQEGWGYVPLSVRYRAADAADATVSAWTDGHPIDPMKIVALARAAIMATDGYSSAWEVDPRADVDGRTLHDELREALGISQEEHDNAHGGPIR